jgi:copper chaperone
MQNKIINIPNISCEHCVHAIKSELGSLEGVISIDVDKDSKEVTIAWHDEILDWDSIKNLLAEINYPLAE